MADWKDTALKILAKEVETLQHELNIKIMYLNMEKAEKEKLQNALQKLEDKHGHIIDERA